MKHLRKPTIPTAPWDIPGPTGPNWHLTPDEERIQAALDRAKARAAEKEDIHSIPPNQSKPASALIGRVFMGRLNVSDLDYMAKAILQICDEHHELRERVRVLEDAERKRRGEA